MNNPNNYSISSVVCDWTFPENVDIAKLNRDTGGCYGNLLSRPVSKWPPGGKVMLFTNYGEHKASPYYFSDDCLSLSENYIRRKLLEASASASASFI